MKDWKKIKQYLISFLKDEVIKAEIELLYNDKIRNEERINNPSKYIFRDNTPTITNNNFVKYEKEIINSRW